MKKIYNLKSIISVEDFAKDHSLKEEKARNVLMNKVTQGKCMMVFKFKTDFLDYNPWTSDTHSFLSSKVKLKDGNVLDGSNFNNIESAFLVIKEFKQ